MMDTTAPSAAPAAPAAPRSDAAESASQASRRSTLALTDERFAPLLENRRRFLRFLERRVGDRQTAEDLLQEAFGKAVERAETLRDEGLVPWFLRVLRNAVVDHYRRAGASARGLDALARQIDPAVPPPEVPGRTCSCVRRLAAGLKPEYADALERVDVEGVPVKAYAEATGISQSNAGVRVHRARHALRKQVLASCGNCAARGCTDCDCGRGGGRGRGRVRAGE